MNYELLLNDRSCCVTDSYMCVGTGPGLVSKSPSGGGSGKKTKAKGSPEVNNRSKKKAKVLETVKPSSGFRPPSPGTKVVKYVKGIPVFFVYIFLHLTFVFSLSCLFFTTFFF